MPYLIFVQTYCAYTISTGPKRPAEQCSLCFQHLPMYPNCALALQKADGHCHAAFRRDTQYHVNMIQHRVAVLQVYPLLPTQLSKYLTNSMPNLAIDNLLPILRQNDHMILAFPLNMCLSLAISHDGPPCPSGPSSTEDRLSNSRTKRQSLFNSHRQSRWITFD